MILGIDPKNDYAFKRVFGSEQHTNILIHLLNAVLDLPAGPLHWMFGFISLIMGKGWIRTSYRPRCRFRKLKMLWRY